MKDWKEPTAADYPQAEKWLWEVLRRYSQQIRDLTKALQGGLGAEHENAEIRRVAVRHGVMLAVKSTKVTSRPVGVQIISTPYRCEVPVMEAIGPGECYVTIYFTTSPPPTGEVEVTLKIIGG